MMMEVVVVVGGGCDVVRFGCWVEVKEMMMNKTGGVWPGNWGRGRSAVRAPRLAGCAGD